MFNEWNYTKAYATIATLEKKLNEFDDYKTSGALIVQVPSGKNEGKYSAIFPFRGGDNMHWMHRGYKVMG